MRMDGSEAAPHLDGRIFFGAVARYLTKLRNESIELNIMRVLIPTTIMLAAIFLSLSGCNQHGEAQEEGHGHAEHGHEGGHEAHGHTIVVTTPIIMDVTATRQYVCQIHSRRHIDIRALEEGYLEEVPVKEGQSVKHGDLLFKVVPVLYQAKLDSELAEADLARIEYDNTKKLLDQKVVSAQELALAQAKLNKALAKVSLAKAELNFANIKAPFDGIIDRLHEQQGSLLEEGAILTTLSDNEVMWVYFNVPEAQYLEYKTDLAQHKDQMKIQLRLANGKIFPHIGEIGAIEADFNNETGNIAFRADFPNPDSLLRHGQTGTILISRSLKDALVIPQRAKFEILAKQYVFVVDKDGIVHQRDIEVDTDNMLEDIYVIKSGLDVNDKIILEGIRQVRDGDKVEYEFQAPEEVLEHLKYRAE